MTANQLHQAIRAFERELQAIKRKQAMLDMARRGSADVRRIEVRAVRVKAHTRAAHTRLVFKLRNED